MSHVIIQNQVLDAERALYGSDGVQVLDCRFDGPADGESALKESKNILVKRCFFNLRYPFWHDRGLIVRESEMTELCRAALWYSEDIDISDSRLHGIKALRECDRVRMERCDVISPEFGWSTRDARLVDVTMRGEYAWLRAEDLTFDRVTLEGKYSFQYVRGALLENCTLHTKDAFWHAENVTLKNCTVQGEYLAWYSKNVTFENCRIIGTQPLCYCTGLRLINCEMVDADLAFERSEVEATLTAPVLSIKNPRAGRISLPAPCECIMDDPDARGVVAVE